MYDVLSNHVRSNGYQTQSERHLQNRVVARPYQGVQAVIIIGGIQSTTIVKVRLINVTKQPLFAH